MTQGNGQRRLFLFDQRKKLAGGQTNHTIRSTSMCRGGSGRDCRLVKTEQLKSGPLRLCVADRCARLCRAGGSPMTETKTPATFSDKNDTPNGQQTQQAQENPGKTASRPGERPKPGRKPLFRT
jgi:hypothetical protein